MIVFANYRPPNNIRFYRGRYHNTISRLSSAPKSCDFGNLSSHNSHIRIFEAADSFSHLQTSSNRHVSLLSQALDSAVFYYSCKGRLDFGCDVSGKTAVGTDAPQYPHWIGQCDTFNHYILLFAVDLEMKSGRL